MIATLPNLQIPTPRWKDVPEPVCNYTHGGLPSAQEVAQLQRKRPSRPPLTSDEAQQFTHHVRRITSILALH
jgi:hypothetical protein